MKAISDRICTYLWEHISISVKYFGSDKGLQGNTDKCHLILSTESDAEIRVGESLIKSTACEKLLGFKIDQHLNFDDHVKSICKKPSGKLRSLARVTQYVSVEKRKFIMDPFFNAQVNYCPLMWMLYSRCDSNKIKHLHKRCLRLIYNDNRSSYKDLLKKDTSVFIHHKNIQDAAIKMFKFKNSLTPKTVNDLFDKETENHYNPRYARVQ